jgi:hypothetical protein
MTTFTWDAGDGTSTGDWTTPANWDQNSSYPQAGDTAIFPSGKHKCYVNVASACTDVQIQGDQGDTILELQNSLTLSGDLTITSGIVNLGAGGYTLTVGGDLLLSPAGAGTNTNAQLTCGNAAVVVTGKLQTAGVWHSGGYTPKSIYDGGTGNHEYNSMQLLVGTDVTLSAGVSEIKGEDGGAAFRPDVNTTYNTYDNGDGTVKFTSNSLQKLYSTSQAASAYKQFYNLILEKTSSTLQGLSTVGFDIRVENDLTVTTGVLNTETTTNVDFPLTVEGNTKISDGGTITGNDSVLAFGTNGVHGSIEAGTLWVEDGGTLTFGSSDVTVYGGWVCKPGGAITSTGGGDFIIAGRTNNGFIFSHSNKGLNITGDVRITFASDSLMDCRGSPGLICGSLIYEPTSGTPKLECWSNQADQTLSISGNVDITTQTFESDGNGGQQVDVYVTKEMTLYSGATWTGGSGDDKFGCITLSGNSTFNCSTGVTMLTGNVGSTNEAGYSWTPFYQRASATFNHNNGTFHNKSGKGYVAYQQWGSVVGPFYNYIQDFVASHNHTFNTDIVCEGDATMSGACVSYGGVWGLRNENQYDFFVSGNLTLLSGSGVGGLLYQNTATPKMIVGGNVIMHTDSKLTTATGSLGAGWEIGGNLINNGGTIF